MRAEKLILSEEKTVTLQLISEWVRFHFLCKKLHFSVQLSKNKLLHWIEQSSHLWSEDSVREMKSTKICLYLHCFSVSLSDNVEEILYKVKKRLSDQLLLHIMFQRDVSQFHSICRENLKQQNKMTADVVNSLCSDILLFFLHISLLSWQSLSNHSLNTLFTFRLCFSVIESSH